MVRASLVSVGVAVSVFGVPGCQASPKGDAAVSTFASQGEVGVETAASEVTGDTGATSASGTSGPKLDLPDDTGASAEEGARTYEVLADMVVQVVDQSYANTD